MNTSNLITVSRLKSLNACPQAHYYRYEAGISSDREAKALRFGRIYHVGLDLLARGKGDAEVCDRVRENYATIPEYADPHAWMVECETVMRLLLGWMWRWHGDGIEVLRSEFVFNLPIINPESGAATTLFRQSGKIDQKIRLQDGRIAIREFKTTADGIEADGDYWSILRLDPQISAYFSAEPEAETIMYDVTHKPGISPLQIPLVDEFGLKIVLDGDGHRVFLDNGKPRQSADKAKGWALQTRLETPEEFGTRLTEDISNRPDFYYARREIPRLTADLADYKRELWEQQKLLRFRQLNDTWPRHASRNTCDYCAYKAPCFNGQYRIGDQPPNGFSFLSNVHPELEIENGDDISSTATAPSTETAKCTTAGS